jgi:hypothetical protein
MSRFEIILILRVTSGMKSDLVKSHALNALAESSSRGSSAALPVHYFAAVAIYSVENLKTEVRSARLDSFFLVLGVELWAFPVTGSTLPLEPCPQPFFALVIIIFGGSGV